MSKNLFVIAGSIGSGKTAFASNLLSHTIFQELEYVNADLYMKKFFKITDNTKFNHKLAKKYMAYKQENLMKNSKDFIWEMVPSKLEKLRILEYAKQKYGYKIYVFYIYTIDVNINRERVLLRSKEGGEAVFDSKVKSRYEMCVENYQQLVKLADVFFAIDFSTFPGSITFYKYEA